MSYPVPLREALLLTRLAAYQWEAVEPYTYSAFHQILGVGPTEKNVLSLKTHDWIFSNDYLDLFKNT